jgi:hypothetical protein
VLAASIIRAMIAYQTARRNNPEDSHLKYSLAFLHLSNRPFYRLV